MGKIPLVRVAYDLPEGKVYVDVLAAIEKEHYESADSMQRVKVIMPALRVTTYEDYDSRGVIRLRGKGYSIDHVHVRTPYEERPWDGDSVTYHQRYVKTEAGNPLDWRSPTGARIRQFEESVRDRFVAEYPEWEIVSKRKRLEGMLGHAESEARRHAAAVAKAEQEAAVLEAEIEAL